MTDPSPQAGRFAWHDLMALDARQARDFYVSLLGWQTKEVARPGGSITVFSAGERDVADVVPLDASSGMPSHWTCYITVDDLDATVAKAQALGGQVVLPATDMPPWGRIAGILDPAGAYFQAFQPAQPMTRGLTWPSPHGTFAWFELMTPEPTAIAPFYEALFGWTTELGMEMEQGNYWMFKRGEESRAGLMGMPPDVPQANWLAYIAVDDLDQAVGRVSKLGGSVMAEPMAVPGTGRFAVIQDPVGAFVALFQAEA